MLANKYSLKNLLPNGNHHPSEIKASPGNHGIVLPFLAVKAGSNRRLLTIKMKRIINEKKSNNTIISDSLPELGCFG